MTIQEYIIVLNNRYKAGISREHSYRGDLEQLIRSLVTGVEITNEPQNVTDCGNPDYVITKGKIPVGFIEAKDIDKDLNSKNYKEQFDRYRKALDNLIITNYIWFQFYQNGELVAQISIAEIKGNKLTEKPENYAEFANLIQNFCTFVGQTIKSPKRLAELMAAKARLLENTLERALNSDEQSQENSSLKEQYESFKHILIHDLTIRNFADIYAQTLAYGMFAARLHDTTLDSFSRMEAAELIPKTNPFLRRLFGYIAGPDIDERIKTTVDNLADVFRATNIDSLLKNFGKSTQTSDPIIHFYETFLSEYDPKLRKARGVWYTPAPVVNFIVRAVDDILKSEFDLPHGLADTSKTKIKVNVQGQNKIQEQEVHKVQILDPATGTGTFLAEVIKHVHRKFEGQQGIWSNYVETHLLPRLNGFELLMASYAMAHLKLDLLLTETGFKPTKDQRFRVFLTNSLEEHHPDTGTLFANWLSSEANEANRIKRDTPVMCIIGNPPYSVSSSNKSEWIEKLTADYKKDLNEKNIQSLSDDYIKFIRFGQHFIDKNGSGVLAYISNNSFIDGITHRQMRKHLLESFDKIYILDLHGNAKKKEVCLDGSTDENVFDIMQGVSINIFVKTGSKKKINFGKVFHLDLQGKRETKYDFLNNNSWSLIDWTVLNPNEPNYFLVKKDFDLASEYEKGFRIDDLFSKNASGITSERDNLTVHFEESKLLNVIDDFKIMQTEDIRNKYSEKPDGRDWKMTTAKHDIINNKGKTYPINYRPFDIRRTYYTGKSKGFMSYPRYDLMKHLLSPNTTLIIGRQGQAVGSMPWNVITITNTIVDSNIFYRGRGTVFPLYLYPETNAQQTIDQTTERTPNLNAEIVNQIAEKLGLRFTNEKEESTDVMHGVSTFAPIDILDYIYAVLHSPTYREKYKEFLKIDFPRVPYPCRDAMHGVSTFWKLVKLGSELRQIHLLESPTVEKYITQYPIDGTNEVNKPHFSYSPPLEGLGEVGKVYINETQYFDNVPEVAWNFYIGGYQPAQKWLKDRKGRTLEFEDILHYQKIIVALSETDRIMKEIDKIEIV